MGNAQKTPKTCKRASAAKSLGYALTLADGEAWEQFTTIIMARLTVEERAGLAWAALNSLDDDTAHLIASASLYGVGEVLA